MIGPLNFEDCATLVACQGGADFRVGKEQKNETNFLFIYLFIHMIKTSKLSTQYERIYKWSKAKAQAQVVPLPQLLKHFGYQAYLYLMRLDMEHNL